jgi:hypothetical protein
MTVHQAKQIEISLGDGVSVNGRIDLVRRIDTGETGVSYAVLGAPLGDAERARRL